MELKWLEDFSAVASSRSFSAAARARHVTQPALSRRVRALEDWYGQTLFDRIAELGGHPLIINPGESQIGHKESIADTARVLGRMASVIVWRVVDSAEAVFNVLGVQVH